jgi:MoxR-like ATPase
LRYNPEKGDVVERTEDTGIAAPPARPALARLGQIYDVMRAEAARVVVGQQDAFQQMLVALFTGGHVLLEGVPGTAKTLMAKTLALLVSAGFARVQFTPDLMPSDITGTNVFDLASSTFTLRRGPVFTNIVLADEINRAPAKTQSALLEAMEERQVTIDGVRHALPDPFMVLATQNPVEYEGTYPLPEAELDRFIFKALVRYPATEEERAILRAHDHGQPSANILNLEPFERGILETCRTEVDAVKVEDSVLDYVGRIAAESRKSPDLILGASPRAAVHLLRAAKAEAATAGRDYVTPDDVKSLATPTLRHRLVLKAEAEIDGLDADAVCRRVLARLDVPR